MPYTPLYIDTGFKTLFEDKFLRQTIEVLLTLYVWQSNIPAPVVAKIAKSQN